MAHHPFGKVRDPHPWFRPWRTATMRWPIIAAPKQNQDAEPNVKDRTLQDSAAFADRSDDIESADDTDDVSQYADDVSQYDEDVLGSFPVDGDEIDHGTGAPKQVRNAAAALWTRFAELIPTDQRPMVTELDITSPVGPDGDGGAFVYQDEKDPTKWILGLAKDSIEWDDLDTVLIHEFGHLFTL